MYTYINSDSCRYTHKYMHTYVLVRSPAYVRTNIGLYASRNTYNCENCSSCIKA